jgi:WD40 repeat protein
MNNLIYKSENFITNNSEHFIKIGKFCENNNLIIVTNDNYIYKYHYLNNNYINSEYNFKESNYIYDIDIFNELNYPNLIFICSKDNPIRIFNSQLKIEKSILLQSYDKEIIFTPNFIKLDKFGLFLFSGKNFLNKIDLITFKSIFINYNEYSRNLFSCFDYNFKYNFYVLGDYDKKNLYLIDYKTDKIINKFKQDFSINQIKILEKKDNLIFVGYRNSKIIKLFDIRNLNKEIKQFEKNNLTSQKINFILNENEEFLFTAGFDRKIIKYNINTYEKILEMQNNDYISSLDYLNNMLLITFGKRNFIYSNLKFKNNNFIDEFVNDIKFSDNEDFNKSYFSLYCI